MAENHTPNGNTAKKQFEPETVDTKQHQQQVSQTEPQVHVTPMKHRNKLTDRKAIFNALKRYGHKVDLLHA